MSDATRRDNDATEVREWLPVDVAAQRLNVSERTIQRKAAAGDLPSQMDGRRLLVCVAALPEQTPEVADSDATEAKTSRLVAEETPRVATSALIDSLQEQVTWLRRKVEAHEKSEDELRRLLLIDRQEIARLLEENRKLLAAPPVQDTAESPQEARTDTPPGEIVIHTPETSEASETGIVKSKPPRRWFEFWKRTN